MSPTRLLLAAVATAVIAAPSVALAQAQAPAAPPAPAPAAAAPAPAMDKPVVANGDTLATLKLDGRFTTFVKAIDSTNLAAVIKNPGLTVFAPTDAALAALPPADLAKLNADKTAMQRMVLHHVINAPISGDSFKGKKGMYPSGATDKILLDGSDENALKADGATIVQKDIKTSTGTLHIVDHVLIAGQGDPTMPETAAAAPAAAAPTKQ